MLEIRTAPLNSLFGRLVAPATERSILYRYGIATALPLAALFFTAKISILGQTPFFPLFTIAAVFSAIFGGARCGLLTTAECVIINLLFSPPKWSLQVASAEYSIRIGIFALVTCVIAWVIGLVGDLYKTIEIQRSQLLITLRSIGDAVIATDVEGNVTFMNPVAEDVTGWTIAEARGIALEGIFRILNERTRVTVNNPVREVLEKGCIVGLANHTLLVRKDGTEVPIDDSAAPIRNPHGHIVGVVLVFRDISQAHLTEKALKRADRLAVAGKLASTLAHEMNNPLQAVSALLFLLDLDPCLSLESKRNIEAAQFELHRAIENSRRLLSLRQVEKKLAPVNLWELADSVLELYKTTANYHLVELKNEIPRETMLIVAPAELRQLLSNLIANALDAMPRGGTLNLNAITEDENGSVRLTIADTGEGIDPSHLEHIFEPFFTTKDDVGAGLGLWVAKRIAEDHEGHIVVESGKDGTIFTLILPSEQETCAH